MTPPVKQFQVIESGNRVYLQIGDRKTGPEVILEGYESFQNNFLPDDLDRLAAGKPPGYGNPFTGTEEPGGCVVMDNRGFDWPAMGKTARRLLGGLTMRTIARLTNPPRGEKNDEKCKQQ